ncbi:MAG: hypothetical protein MJA29_08050, partial [Candidatus Omnitrophica bacterium]|nr:hypothetical protein [Candidatus Omnitrophota bacterium]
VLIRGITGEMLKWNKSFPGSPIEKVYRIRSDEKDQLELLGEVQLGYSFKGYETKQHRVSYYRNNPSIEFKWPRYTYHVLNETDMSILNKIS